MKFLRRLLARNAAPDVAPRPPQVREKQQLECRRCGRVVIASRDLFYDVFERMHALCFHLEYEHDGDPDLPCLDPACHAANNVFLEQLSETQSWEEGFTTIPYKYIELEKFLQEPTFLGPEEVRKIIRQARFATYLTRELLRNYASTSNDAIVRIAKAALGTDYVEEPAG